MDYIKWVNNLYLPILYGPFSNFKCSYDREVITRKNTHDVGINTNLNLIKDDCNNINGREVIARENTRDVGINTDLNLTKGDFNKSEMCSLLSVDLESVKLDAIITESKLTNNIRSNREGINENKEIIKQIELGRTSTLNTIETKLSKISATSVAACENEKVISYKMTS